MSETEPKPTKELKITKPVCPYCNADIAEGTFCEVCQVTIWHCPVCHETFDRGILVCPHCGTEIKEVS